MSKGSWARVALVGEGAVSSGGGEDMVIGIQEGQERIYLQRRTAPVRGCERVHKTEDLYLK